MDNLENVTTAKKVGAVLAYSLCSSTMLLANKVIMTYIPLPSVVSVLQIIFATLTCLILKYGVGITIDDLETSKLKPYSLYIVAFVSAIFSNMQALNATNVETVIVFRACTPMATSFIEYFFMNRALPTKQSWLSLLIVGFGAVVYCMADSQLAVQGVHAYFWVILYFGLITFEMTYGKTLTSNVKMDSVWGPVFYQNILSIIPMTALGIMAGEISSDSVTALQVLSPVGLGVLLFSCITGTLIGYTAWLCRGMLSATTFTLVGVVNKFLTILLNILIWDKHASPLGTLAVCVCLGAGVFYRQAPKREIRKVIPMEQTDNENEMIEKDFLLSREVENEFSPVATRSNSNDSGVTTVSTQGSVCSITRNNSVELSDHLGSIQKSLSQDRARDTDSNTRKKKQQKSPGGRYF